VTLRSWVSKRVKASFCALQISRASHSSPRGNPPTNFHLRTLVHWHMFPAFDRI
jgi:hypothetical protein